MNVAVSTLAVLILGAPGLAQDTAGDWELSEAPSRNLTMATLEYEGAPAIAARCVDGEAELMIAGLSPVAEETRDVVLEVAGSSVSAQWRTVSGSIAAALIGGMTLRDLMAGGEVVVTVRDTQPARRFRLQAPPASRAVGRVLAACGYPLTSERDAERRLMRDEWRQRVAAGEVRPDGPSWVRRPTGRYPNVASDRGIRAGHAQISCYAQANGRLRDCVVEAEYPVGMGFGAEAVRGAQDGRLTARPDSASKDELITFTTRMRLD